MQPAAANIRRRKRIGSLRSSSQPAVQYLLGALLLYKIERAGSPHDAEALVAGACAFRVLDLGLDGVAIFRALRGEDPTGVFP